MSEQGQASTLGVSQDLSALLVTSQPSAIDPAKFFNPWEAPPHYVPAPFESTLTQRIQKLAQFASRNGPSFIELISNKQAGNPEYAFLAGGEGSTYFRWVLYCNLQNLNRGQPSFSNLAWQHVRIELLTPCRKNKSCIACRSARGGGRGA